MDVVAGLGGQLGSEKLRNMLVKLRGLGVLLPGLIIDVVLTLRKAALVSTGVNVIFRGSTPLKVDAVADLGGEARPMLTVVVSASLVATQRKVTSRESTARNRGI